MLQINQHHSHCANLADVVPDTIGQKLQTTSIFHNKQFNAMLLTIPAGHTLKEHVSSRMLTLSIISGSGTVSVDGKTYPVSPGAWFYIEANTSHELVSDETLLVLLSLYAESVYEAGESANE